MSSSSGTIRLGKRTTVREEDLHPLTRAEEEALWEVIQYGTLIAKKYFHYGEEIGCAVRDRMIESVVRNARIRGHITHRKEIHTIIKRCYADEIRWKFGSDNLRAKRGHHGAHQEINDRVLEDTRTINDGGLTDAEVRMMLETEADALMEEWETKPGRRGKAPEATVAVARAMAANVGGNLTMQEIADAAGVSKASVSRAARILQKRMLGGNE